MDLEKGFREITWKTGPFHEIQTLHVKKHMWFCITGLASSKLAIKHPSYYRGRWLLLQGSYGGTTSCLRYIILQDIVCQCLVKWKWILRFNRWSWWTVCFPMVLLSLSAVQGKSTSAVSLNVYSCTSVVSYIQGRCYMLSMLDKNKRNVSWITAKMNHWG